MRYARDTLNDNSRYITFDVKVQREASSIVTLGDAASVFFIFMYNYVRQTYQPDSVFCECSAYAGKSEVVKQFIRDFLCGESDYQPVNHLSLVQ